MRQHFPIIDVYISLLLILVIIGHCLFPGYPAGYGELHRRIYAFHMVAFYGVCGFLVCHAYRPLSTLKEYATYIGRKLRKFGMPFLLFGVTLTCVQVLWLQHEGISDLKQALRDLLLYPSGARVIYLWFIYLLFEFYLLAPLLISFNFWTSKKNSVVLLDIPYASPLEEYCPEKTAAVREFFLEGEKSNPCFHYLRFDMLARHGEYYADKNHLNPIGQKAATSMLVDYLSKPEIK